MCGIHVFYKALKLSPCLNFAYLKLFVCMLKHDLKQANMLRALFTLEELGILVKNNHVCLLC